MSQIELYKIDESNGKTHSYYFTVKMLSFKLTFLILTISANFSTNAFSTLVIDNLCNNTSNIISGISEIFHRMKCDSILVLSPIKKDLYCYNFIEELLIKFHELSLQTFIYTDTKKYYRRIQLNQLGAIGTTSLILTDPSEILNEV